MKVKAGPKILPSHTNKTWSLEEEEKKKKRIQRFASSQPEKKQKTAEASCDGAKDLPMNGVIAYITVPDGKGQEACEWYVKALGAKETRRADLEKTGKIMHTGLIINGGYFYLSDDFPEHSGGKAVTHGTSVCMHLNLDDADVVWDKAVKEGAKVLMPLEDQFWGDRYGKLQDPFGFVWAMMSKAKKTMTPEESAKVQKEMFGE